MEPVIKNIREALMDGDAQLVKGKTEEALKIGITAKKIIKAGLMPGMKLIGEKFRANEIFIPDVLMASRAMHASLYVLRPILANSNSNSNSKIATKGRIVLGTVAGDLHDIGKNMVVMMLEGAGYEVIDIGIDVPPGNFVKAVKEHKPEILAISALLTTTMGELNDVISQLKEEELRDQVKVLVGGGPVTPEFAIAIDADAYAADSYNAIEAVNRLIAGEVGFIEVA